LNTTSNSNKKNKNSKSPEQLQLLKLFFDLPHIKLPLDSSDNLQSTTPTTTPEIQNIEYDDYSDQYDYLDDEDYYYDDSSSYDYYDSKYNASSLEDTLADYKRTKKEVTVTSSITSRSLAKKINVAHKRGCKQLFVKAIDEKRAIKKDEQLIVNRRNVRVCERRGIVMPVYCDRPVTTPSPYTRSSRPIHSHTELRKEDQDLALAIQASLTVNPTVAGGLTYQQIMELATRELNPNDYELLLLLDESVAKKTTSASKVDALPRIKAVDGHLTSKCTICQSDYELEELLIQLPCAHLFHDACLTRWLTTQSTKCPLDAKEI